MGGVLLLVVWLVLFVLACAWWTAHPRRLPWLAGSAWCSGWWSWSA